MILTTVGFVSGYEVETIGLVKGSIVKTKNMFTDVFQGLKSMIGGKLKGYTEMMDEARQKATDRMVKQAEELGADAVIGIHFATSGNWMEPVK